MQAALRLEGASLGRPEAQAPHSVTVGGPLLLCTPPVLSPLHFQLLGLFMATMAAVTHFGDHFTVIRQVALERNPYEAMHYWAFYVGISLAGLLSLGAALSTIATVREAHGLMAAGFLCFALSFCVQVQVAFWRFHNPTQVEDAVLDTYDLVYDQAMKSPSSSWWQELATIQDMFLCCGKKSPFGFLASTRAILCQGQEAMREVRRRGRERLYSDQMKVGHSRFYPRRDIFILFALLASHILGSALKSQGCTRPLHTALPWQGTYETASSTWPNSLPQASIGHDCLQRIGNFLWTHSSIASTLTCTSLALTVYAMMLCAFLWFAIHSYCGLDRKGRYTLTPRIRKDPVPAARKTLLFPEYLDLLSASSIHPHTQRSDIWIPTPGICTGPLQPMAASPRNPASSDGPRMECLNALLKHKHLPTIRHPSEAWLLLQTLAQAEPPLCYAVSGFHQL
ncbi:hypothetical protein U0070_013155, partial [Myodes glareolus]